ncbi:putative 1-acyl-sn-glycerol-3-phosphate acyltransferase acl-2 isoform X2 [Condylostylus longicornis]|nr:putative 1-acyl-sn-glycerol-3-phosphate acyltransferase acl-2 isoform X2 [Condylostylus longicornis]
MASWLCVHFCRIFLGITMEIKGRENLQQSHGNVLIMNHQSYFDVLAISYIWPVIDNITAVAKKQLLYVPFFGIGLWKSGFLFIDRKNRSQSINTLNTESKAINEKNCKILVFPEGTCNSEETLLPFKKGPFYMAIQCSCPIQPIIVTHYDWLHKDFRESKAVINILPEISTKDYEKENVNELIEMCQNKLQKEYDQINLEFRNNQKYNIK